MLNFMGIGAQKCGTSWLYSALTAHPQITFPGGKEVHYWNRPGDRSLGWYTQLFADETHLNGDITPAYAFLPLETIQTVHKALPDLRLIYLIRDPMQRAWSSARMALARAEMTHEDASDQWFIDHFRSQGSLIRGDYETCIRTWRSVFPPEQLLIIRYETIATDPVGIANRCLNHIGIDRLYSQADRKQLEKKVFEGDGMPLRPKLSLALASLYSARIKSLSAYLAEDLSQWGQTQQRKTA